MRIPAGSVLNKRYVTIGEDAFLQRFIEDPKKREELGIIYANGRHRVPIYEVIDGLAFAERKSEHMLAGYQEELNSLRNTVAEARALMADTNFRSAAKEERDQMRLVILYSERRILNIQTIIAEHVSRQVTLHFAFQRACSRLTEMAVLLERIAYHIRTRNVRIGAIQRVTNQILSELPFFNSKEIRHLTRSVRIALTALSVRTDTGTFATYVLSDKLKQAATLLFDSVVLLQTEASRVEEKESQKAAEIITFGP